MILILILYFVLAFLSFGSLALNYVYTRKASTRSWKIKMDAGCVPKVSVIVPTFNEQEIIGYKLRNLAKLKYPKDLLQLVFVDSQSTDFTVNLIKIFIENHPEINAKIIVEKDRKGKSSALNTALKTCKGDIVIVSDADCFWPPDILLKSLPYLADPAIGAISGPKMLLNSENSYVTTSENAYLNSMNLMKLGESKKSSTVFFEGGFSAYKKDALESFDPYGTGSDDCGTVIRILEKGFKAIMVPEAKFYTTFPETWKGKIEIKIRRATQLILVFWKYAMLFSRNRIKTGKGTVLRNLFVYLFAPWFFLFFVITTFYLLLVCPSVILILTIFLLPKVNRYTVEAVLNYSILIFATVSAVLRKKFVVWKKPQDRALFTEDMLIERGLI